MTTLFRILDLLVTTYAIVLNVTQSQQCDNNWMMVKKKVIPEEDFQRQMRRHYIRMTSRRQCFKDCKTDERCTGIMVCSGGCYLLGVFIWDVSTTENYASCNLFPVDRCKNGGQQEDSGYCSCPFGFGGRFCEMFIDDKCYTRWRAVYDTESTESKNDLLSESSKECPVMLKIALNGRVQNVDQYGVDVYDVWAQTSHQLTKTSWDYFETTPQRRFDNVRSNRYMATMKYTIGGTPVFSSTSTLAIKWFVKQHTTEVPDFISNTNATAIDFEKLLVKVKNGAAVSLFDTIFVSSNQSLIAAERLGSVAMINERPIDQFLAPGHWNLVKYATSSGYSCIQWTMGYASAYRNVDISKWTTFWCTDDCWRKALSTEVNGSVSFGSISDIASSILNGHAIRVYFNGIAAKTKAIYIHGKKITVLLHDIMDPLDVGFFSSSATAYMVIASTSGAVTMRGYTYESRNIVSETEEVHSVQWYTDTRQWIKVLVVKGDGTKRYGSVTELKNFVMEAASVRLVVEYTSGMRQAMDVDHLEIAADGNVAADIINHSAVHKDGSKLSFDSATSYHRWSAIITTHGHFQKYHYTFQRSDGITEEISSVFTFSWFVQQ